MPATPQVPPYYAPTVAASAIPTPHVPQFPADTPPARRTNVPLALIGGGIVVIAILLIIYFAMR